MITPLKRPEYMRMNLADIPQEIIDEYNLKDTATPDGSIHIVATKAKYRLPQAGLIANEVLENMTQQRRVQAKQTSAWIVDTRLETNTVHTSS